MNVPNHVFILHSVSPSGLTLTSWLELPHRSLENTSLATLVEAFGFARRLIEPFACFEHNFSRILLVTHRSRGGATQQAAASVPGTV